MLCVFMPPVDRLEEYLELARRGRRRGRRPRPHGPHRGLRAALRSAPRGHQGHARSRRDRGQRPARRRPGARRSTITARRLRGRARRSGSAPTSSCSTAAISAPAAATTWCWAAPTPNDSPFVRRPDLLKSIIALLAAPPGALDAVLGPVYRPDQPGAAHRRGPPRRALRDGDRARPGAGAAASPTSGPGWSTGCSATCSSTSPATRTAPRSASTSSGRPTAPTGRLGLVEFRAFEMPPDARMSLAQQLLLRGARRLVLARAARRARWCAGAPRCTTASCCRISSGRTSSTCSRDLERRRLRASIPPGSRRSASSASRIYGTVERDGVTLELRQALEPWHVLGEEGIAGRHGPLRRLPRSSGCRSSSSGATPGRQSWPATAAGCRWSDRHRRRVRGRRAVQGVAAGPLACSRCIAGPCAADLRHRRPLERPLDRRLRLSRRPTRAAAASTPSRSTPTRPRRRRRARF